MINDEFLVKIDTIIEYLEKNGGRNFKLYNHTCPKYDKVPDSNIVEYAEDIRDYWRSLKYDDNLESYIKMEINKIIMDNLDLFSFDDSKLVLLKEYCKTHLNTPLQFTPSDILMSFVQEALLDLLNSNLYDFRCIE